MSVGTLEMTALTLAPNPNVGLLTSFDGSSPQSFNQYVESILQGIVQDVAQDISGIIGDLTGGQTQGCSML
jgi:hypothetical protein